MPRGWPGCCRPAGAENRAWALAGPAAARHALPGCADTKQAPLLPGIDRVIMEGPGRTGGPARCNSIATLLADSRAVRYFAPARTRPEPMMIRLTSGVRAAAVLMLVAGCGSVATIAGMAGRPAALPVHGLWIRVVPDSTPLVVTATATLLW